jgi:Tfp pilus assembly protein PilV
MKKLIIKGFSVIEVLISLALMSIGVLAVMGVFIVSYKMNFNADNMNFALYNAQKKMDYLIKTKNLISTTTQTENVNYEGTGNPRPGWQLSYAGSAPSENYQQITVTVNWVEKREGGSYTRTVQLVSALAR